LIDNLTEELETSLAENKTQSREIHQKDSLIVEFEESLLSSRRSHENFLEDCRGFMDVITQSLSGLPTKALRKTFSKKMNLTLNQLEDTIIDFGDIVSDNIKSHQELIFQKSSVSKISKSQKNHLQSPENRHPGPTVYINQGESDINNF
jgi:hypothetical protein